MIIEKFWETQLWRFEKVFEHFIMFTELADAFNFNGSCYRQSARHCDLVSIGEAFHRNLAS